MSDADIKGYWAYEEIFDEMRKRLRTGGSDSWIGASPSRAELEEMLGGDRTMIDILFDASIADVLESYVSDRRLQNALYGQGIIGAYAGQRDWGTVGEAHALPGRSAGSGTRVGLRRGRHGPHQLRHRRGGDLGAVLAAGVPVAEILPGEGSGSRRRPHRAKVVVSNADPKRALGMLVPDAVPDPFRARLEVADPVAGREVQRPLDRLRPSPPHRQSRGRTAR